MGDTPKSLQSSEMLRTVKAGAAGVPADRDAPSSAPTKPQEPLLSPSAPKNAGFGRIWLSLPLMSPAETHSPLSPPEGFQLLFFQANITHLKFPLSRLV